MDPEEASQPEGIAARAEVIDFSVALRAKRHGFDAKRAHREAQKLAQLSWKEARRAKFWICMTCDAEAQFPLFSAKRRRTCLQGHDVAEVITFSTGLFTGAIGIPVVLLLCSLIVWLLASVWLPLGALVSIAYQYALLGGLLVPLYGLCKGIIALTKSGPARRLASGYLGIALGFGLLIFVAFLAR